MTFTSRKGPEGTRISRAAVKPSLAAAGEPSWFARPVQYMSLQVPTQEMPSLAPHRIVKRSAAWAQCSNSSTRRRILRALFELPVQDAE
jgi:hypothetical protein